MTAATVDTEIFSGQHMQLCQQKLTWRACFQGRVSERNLQRRIENG